MTTQNQQQKANWIENLVGAPSPSEWRALKAEHEAELHRLQTRIAELEGQLDAIGAGGVEPLRKPAAAPQAVQDGVPTIAELEASAELGALRDVYEMARGVLRFDGIDMERALKYKDGLIEAIETVKTIDGGTWEPAHPAEGVPAQAAKLPPLPEPTAFLVCKGSEVTARAWNVDQMRAYAAAALAATQPAAQVVDARDAAFEAVRKAFCKLQRYSFALDSRGNLRRCADHFGNWVEFEAVHTLFDPQAVDAVIAAQAKQGGA